MSFEYLQRVLAPIKNCAGFEFLLFCQAPDGAQATWSSANLEPFSNTLTEKSLLALQSLDKIESKEDNFLHHCQPPFVKSIDLRDEQLVIDHYHRLFMEIQQVSCKSIAKCWIRELEPLKQSTYPYKNGNQSRPPWWPQDVVHKEPDHIKKEERIKLLTSLMRTGLLKFNKAKGDTFSKFPTTASKLKACESSYISALNPERLLLLNEVYYLSHHEELFKNHHSYEPKLIVSDFDKFKQPTFKPDSVGSSQISSSQRDAKSVRSEAPKRPNSLKPPKRPFTPPGAASTPLAQLSGSNVYKDDQRAGKSRALHYLASNAHFNSYSPSVSSPLAIASSPSPTPNLSYNYATISAPSSIASDGMVASTEPRRSQLIPNIKVEAHESSSKVSIPETYQAEKQNATSTEGLSLPNTQNNVSQPYNDFSFFDPRSINLPEETYYFNDYFNFCSNSFPKQESNDNTVFNNGQEGGNFVSTTGLWNSDGKSLDFIDSFISQISTPDGFQNSVGNNSSDFNSTNTVPEGCYNAIDGSNTEIRAKRSWSETNEPPRKAKIQRVN